MSTPRTSVCGCRCARKAANAMGCHAISDSKNTSAPILTARVSQPIPRAPLSHHRARDGGHHHHSPHPAERPRGDPAAPGGRRDRDQSPQLQLAGHPDHSGSQRRGHALTFASAPSGKGKPSLQNSRPRFSSLHQTRPDPDSPDIVSFLAHNVVHRRTQKAPLLCRSAFCGPSACTCWAIC